MSETIVVRSKDELERAMKQGCEHITVKGELAEKIELSRKIKKLSKPVLAALTAALIAAPLTGGISGAMGLTAAAALSGMEITAIVAVAFLGIALVLKIAEDYDIETKVKHGDSEAEVKMTRKK